MGAGGGAAYRALTGLSYPTDAGILARLRKGERVPLEARAMKRVSAGEVVTDIPARSVGWLIEQGHIELVRPAPFDEAQGERAEGNTDDD